MKNRLLIPGFVMLAALTACSSDDDSQAPVNDTPKLRQLTITPVVTRATLSDVGDILRGSWSNGDAMTYVNFNTSVNNTHGPLVVQYDGTITSFTGTVTCAYGDRLAVIYPATDTFSINSSTGKISGYTIDLTGQDGTLATLANRYHYIYGEGTVNDVTETTAKATVSMKSLLTVVKFIFFDEKNDDTPLNVSSMSIIYGDLSNGYPQKAMVDLTQSDVHAEGEAQESYRNHNLSIILPKATKDGVYVALLPGGFPKLGDTDGRLSFTITVTDDKGKSYTGKAKAALVEGEFAVAQINVQ